MDVSQPTKIMVTTDFSEDASYAFPYAASLARRNDAELLILHVMTDASEDTEPRPQSAAASATATATEEDLGWRISRIQLIQTRSIRVRREVVRAPTAAAGILRRAKAEHPDLIVMSSRGHGVTAQMLLGSVCLKVIAVAPCPVLVVKHGEIGMLNPANGDVRIARILAPTDLSERANDAVQKATRLARDHDAEIHVLHVVHFDVPATIFILPGRPSVFTLDEDMRTRITTRLRSLVNGASLRSEQVTTNVDEGPPARKIAEYAESRDIDLVVLSRSGHTGSPYLLGGVTGRLLHELNRPLLVV